MATTATFDTLKYAEALKTSGVPDVQAKAEAEALADALCQAGQDLSTKADIAELRAELKTDIAELKAEIQAMINRLLLSLTGIIIGSMVAMTGIFAAIVKLL
jgi:predicted TIM-barrel enzyme